jgi:hypothetical protein
MMNDEYKASDRRSFNIHHASFIIKDAATGSSDDLIGAKYLKNYLEYNRGISSVG